MSGCCGEQSRTEIFSVEGMSCNHCKAAVEKAVSALDGVTKAEVNLAAKNVSVIYNPVKVTADDLKKAISDAGYQVL